jgi:stearoyl-CoA desaturase (delta-9 desaturase)
MSWSHLLAAVVAAFIVTQVTTAITTVYLHRALSHRALTVSPAVALPCRAMVWIATGMRPREWVAVHRKHHAATDTPEDPHSPAIVGFWRVQLGNVGLYKKVAADQLNTRKYARDIPTDKLDRWLFDRAFVGLAVGITVIVLIMWALGFGLVTGFLAAGIHAVMYVMLSGAINAVGHTFGTRPHDNSATNFQLLALITSGEGLHNNHHAAPTSARFALQKGEVDPGWWIVRTLTAMKLAHVRHEEVHLKAA